MHMLFRLSFPKHFLAPLYYFRGGDVVMAKATSPYLSEVRGSVAKKLTFRKLKPYDTQLIQSIPVPSYRRTEKQDAQRNKFSVCKSIWNNMSDEDKESYRALGEELALTGYQSFMSKCLSELILYDIYIDNTQNPNDLVNFQVPFEITNDQQFFRDCNYNKNAISFMTGDLKDPVPYYIETWNPDTKSARIWLKVPLIKASSTTTLKLLIVPSKQTTESDPEQVFEFFDDFNDLSKWSLLHGDPATVENGQLVINNLAYSLYGAQTQIQHDAIIETRGYDEVLNNDADLFVGIYDAEVNKLWSATINGNVGIQSVRLAVGETSFDIYTPLTEYTVTPPVKGVLRFIKKGNTIKGEWDGDDGTHWETEELTDTEYNLDNADGIAIGISSSSADTLKYDWVRVRKYADPFPSVTYNKIV